MTKHRRRKPRPEREFHAEVVLRPTPDLHRLAQVFLGMALAQAEADRPSATRPTDTASSTTEASPVD
jgi:hypothetical protein